MPLPTKDARANATNSDSKHVSSEGTSSMMPPAFSLSSSGDSPIQQKPDSSTTPVQMKKADPNKRWGASQFFEGYEDKVDESQLNAAEKAYFDDYAKAAQIYLNRKRWKDTTDMTGEMMAKSAMRAYLKYGKDISKVIPVEFALAQCQEETHFNSKPRPSSPSKNNPFNVGEQDTNTRPWVSDIKDTEQGVSLYYDLMAEDYLSNKNSDELMKEMKNEVGNAYASASYVDYMHAQVPFIKRHIADNGGKLPDASKLNAENGNEGPSLFDNIRAYFSSMTEKREEESAPATKSTNKTGVVTATALNVRSGPGADNPKVGAALKEKAKIEIFETKRGWYRIGEGRWVSGKHIKVGSGSTEVQEKDEESIYKPIADRVHYAMKGAGTYENIVYNELAKLKHDDAQIAAFRKVYKAQFGVDVVEDIRGDFSNTWLFGNELAKALSYLNIVDAKESESSGEQSKEAAGLDKMIKKGAGEFDDATGKGKIRAITEYARKQMQEYPPKVKAFKEQKGMTSDQKVAILGKLALESAKMEFYMGTVFFEGEKWEQKMDATGKMSRSSNSGEFVDQYTKQSSYNGKKAASAWCTKFATYNYSQVLGTRANHRIAGESRRGAWGGSQLSNGYEQFWDYDEKKGGRFAGQTKLGGASPWGKLRVEVAGKTTKKEKVAAIKSFFKTNFKPQPGDIMITGTKSNSFKSDKNKNFDPSHTTMIERVDIKDESAFIYTIEGNSGDRVTGRKYNLLDTTGDFGLNKIVNVSRMSLENHGKSMNLGEQKDIKKLENPATFDENSLLKPIREMNALLKAYAAEEGVINKKGATIFDQSQAPESTATQ